MKKLNAKWMVVAGLLGPGFVLANVPDDKVDDALGRNRLEQPQGASSAPGSSASGSSASGSSASGMSDEKRPVDPLTGRGGSGESVSAPASVPDETQTVGPERPYRQGSHEMDKDKGKGIGGAAQAGMMDEKQHEVLAKLHADNLAEVELGRIAQQKALSKEVKRYGERLVKDHEDADKKLSKLLDKHHLKVDALPQTDELRQMKTQNEENLTDLRKREGLEFDRQFLTLMVQDHQKTISELTEAKISYAQTDLGTYLSEILPTLQKHHDQAQKILDQENRVPPRARRPSGTTR